MSTARNTERSNVTTEDPTMQSASNPAERGQVLVIVALGLVSLLAMVALVIDGGFAWGKQRDTQNAADAAAKAGATKLAENLAGTTPANTDADVLAAMDATWTANEIPETLGYYTNINGQLLQASGALASDESTAAPVGGGVIPPGGAGVQAVGSQPFDTFVAGIVGFDELTATAEATAVSGYLTDTCDADAGCVVLPVIIPVTVLGCDGTNKPAPVTDEDGNKILWPAPSGVTVVPLCANAPGNVGWLDWTPNEQTPGCSGTGKAEIACIIENPSNPYLKWPGWYYVPETGNPNSGPIEDALRQRDGEVVMIPQFDITCDTQPSGPGIEDCPPANVGGNGNQQWYHLAGMSTIKLCSATDADCVSAGFSHGAYTQGNNKPTCDTGNGATSCLVGKFVKIIYEGEVQANPGVNGDSSAVGIQLFN
jgi:Flp pilus assembly protein TadG